MLFNSYIFLIFLAIVVPTYFLLPQKSRNVFLLFCSYFFYGYWDWRFTSLLLISTIIDFFVGKAISRISVPRKRKVLLLISLSSNLMILGFFKYFDFFVDSFQNMIEPFGLKLDFLHLNVILPVGISFYTFQTLSYTIDIYREKLQATNSFIDFAVFVSFFPQLVAGPIERAVNLLPQIQSERKFSIDKFKEGIVLISIGMFRKVIVGDTCGRIVDHIFAQPWYYASLELLMGLILFSVQIYNDFAGYSTIARGTSKLMGFELMENFKQPYLATNITEFWRRWHISLSSWLKDYLYISLGGNRLGKVRTYINLMLTMLLGGLWHGANWTFVVWGGLHGAYLAIHKFMLGETKIKERFQYENMPQFGMFLLKLLATNILVLITWLFFRAKSFDSAFYFIERFYSWDVSDFGFRFLTITATYLAISFIIDILEYVKQDHAFLLRLEPSYRYGILTATWTVILLFLFRAEHMPFVYFQF